MAVEIIIGDEEPRTPTERYITLSECLGKVGLLEAFNNRLGLAAGSDIVEGIFALSTDSEKGLAVEGELSTWEVLSRLLSNPTAVEVLMDALTEIEEPGYRDDEIIE